MHYIIKILSMMLLVNAAAHAQNMTLESGTHQTTLIELYTSEGCSSCPPAEHWLNSFITSPKLFKEVIPLAFHVNYWDYIGWKDPFAKASYGNRQRQHYAERNISQVYTPGMVVNGKEDRTWRSNRVNYTTKPAAKLTANIVNNQVHITFDHKNYDVHVALTGSNFVSKIKAGENEDRELRHNFVVLGYAKKTATNNKTTVSIPSSAIASKDHAIVIWVTRVGRLKPLQAVGSWITI